ncbi:TlpA family protein disulfide reductase [Sphingomonas desiccabilis]|uniref:TlpA family protein disulfide reductase n=1 Tax=Sphingomonas desiccabilis TaxID=429134 RepID=UPI0013EE1E7D|nr:thioredoxin family protein [Sphingomonas desiccabilis]MBB3910204.1 thiol-disulfide isomerase/thioredoxin [Sphingomonas desiccabilis]
MSTAFFFTRRLHAVLAGVVLLSATSAAGEPPAYPTRTVLLFVAGWCAPCRAELQQLPQITAAARPYRVLVVPVDSGRRVEQMLAGVPAVQRWRPQGEGWTRVQADLLSATAGLPYSVALGADGRPCASSRRGLDPARAADLVSRCEASL